MGNPATESALGTYSCDVPLGPDPEPARAALARLDALRAAVVSAEEDVLACLVVTGEPRPQRVLDDWLDQVVDTLRALGETVDRLAPSLARDAAPPASDAASARPPSPAGTTATRRSILRPVRDSRFSYTV